MIRGSNADVIITQKDDPNNANQVLVDINIDKKEKVKVHKITITGNQAITTKKLKRVMKKTNEKGKLQPLPYKEIRGGELWSR